MMSPEPVTEPHPSSSASNYAFISHSQDTLPLNLPASSDNHAPSTQRRRRRRTSPHDQAILEQEYRKCIKPDKSRRREICKLVQMGEKEVQIWFCNKRQAQRRRATPLQPHEMVPNSTRSMVASSSQPSLVSSSPMRGSRHRMTASGHSASSGFSINSSPSALVSTNTVRPFTAHRLHQDDDDIDDIENDEDPVIRNLKESHRNNNHDNELLPQESRERAPAQEAVAMTPVPAASAPMPSTTSTQEPKMTTSAAHRRLQDVLNGGKTNPVTPEKPSILPPPPIPSSHPRRTPANQSLPPPRLLRRSSSAIRLTTNLEGRATVVLEDEPEPASSPPKPPPTPAPRSAKRRPQSTPVDSKLWEFCCDSQSALLRSPQRTPPQPSEATQALRLLRTRRSTLGSAIVPALPRTLSQSQPTTTNQQFLKPTSKKPKPQTLQPPPPPSSVSKKTPAKRLRKVITTAKKAARPKPLSNNPSKDFAIFEQSLDSDKENRPPGAPASPPPEPKRRVLGMSGKGSLNATTATPSKKTMKGKSLYAGPSARKTLGERQQGRHEPDEGYGASQETQCGGGAYEDDIEGDMHGASQDSGIAGGSPRRIDEMECVENLLSLRGGTWR